MTTMTEKDIKYIYVSSTDKVSGKPTERELWRRGSTVELNNLQVGGSLLIRYEEDYNVATVTSVIQDIDDRDGRLTIETMNTVYVFDEEVER